MHVPGQPRRRSSIAAALLATLLMVAVGAASGAAQGESPAASGGPDTPVSSGSFEPGGGGDGATLAVPQAGLTDIRTQGWDHIDVAPDGRTLTVYFWNGVDTCYGLADVVVTDTDGLVTVTLQVGTQPGVEACIEIAQLYQTIVVLDGPVLGGGLVD